MAFENPTPVVVALLRCAGGLIAVQRAIEPFVDQWAFPGGYVDKGENAQIAVAREVFEETGYVFEAELWHPITTLCTPRNQLLIFMTCVDELEERGLAAFVPNPEATGVKVVGVNDELCFSLHTQILKTPGLWT